MKSFATKTLMVSLLCMSAVPVMADTWDEKAKDAWLDGKAETMLLLNSNLNSFDINTDVEQQVVTLTGVVDTEVEKALAEELVIGIEDVKEVNNKLVVNPQSDVNKTSMAALKDAKITTVVKTKLLLNENVNGTAIGVSTEAGVVTLSGLIDSDAERDLALEITKNTNDVNDVVSELEMTK